MLPQNVIAIIWDFDKTLIPGYMQEPLFAHYRVEPREFWREVNALSRYYERQGIDRVGADTLYLNHILSYVRQGIFKGLNNRRLRELGAELTFYPGLPDFFQTTRELMKKEPYLSHELRVEHYIVSTGLRQIILGSAIAPYIDDVWGCEFAESMPRPGYLERLSKDDLSAGGEETGNPLFETGEIDHIVYAIDNTTKTRAIFEINKGTNVNPAISVNSQVPPEQRRVPIRNMVYIADGPSDIPVFSIIRQYGGRSFAVYRHGSTEEFAQACDLQIQGRAEAFGVANYNPYEQAHLWICKAIEDIAKRIVTEREALLHRGVGAPPQHLHGESETKVQD